MINIVKNMWGCASSAVLRSVIKLGVIFEAFVSKYGHACLVVLGVGLLTLGSADIAFAQSKDSFEDTRIRKAICLLLQFIEGAFGALIMVVAGLGAIVAAAMGAYRLAISMLVVAIGAFILRALVDVFFDVDLGEQGGSCASVTA